eukprot:6192596-Pleurochrysis_carterae.AAC.2
MGASPRACTWHCNDLPSARYGFWSLIQVPCKRSVCLARLASRRHHSCLIVKIRSLSFVDAAR